MRRVYAGGIAMNGYLMGRAGARAFTLIELLVVVAIIAILAAMLLPALSAAREKARRGACSGNLGQLSKSIEGYVSDFGGYYPAWCGYGLKADYSAGVYSSDPAYSNRVADQNGIYKDPRTGMWIGTSFRPPTYGASAWTLRTIAIGCRGFPDTSQVETTPRRRGELGQGPFGLGMLVVGGYLPDVRSLYCPSAAGTMVPDRKLWTGKNRGFPLANSIAAWQRAGGYTGQDLTHGDWSWNTRGSNAAQPEYLALTAVQCDYNYLDSPNAFCAPNWGATTTGIACTVAFTKPVVTIGESVPPFKTSRQLAGRALVSDSFSSAPTASNCTSVGFWSSLEDDNSWLGRGIYAHREGYNVLYGDYHVRWYGDAQQQLVWWGHKWTAQPNGWQYENPSRQIIYAGWGSYYNEPGGNADARLEARGVAHLFDMAAGVDLNVPDLSH